MHRKGTNEVKMSRQDKAVLSFLVIDILVILFWSIAIHLGPTGKKAETKERKAFFQAEAINMPVDNREKVYMVTPLAYIVTDELVETTTSIAEISLEQEPELKKIDLNGLCVLLNSTLRIDFNNLANLYISNETKPIETTTTTTTTTTTITTTTNLAQQSIITSNETIIEEQTTEAQITDESNDESSVEIVEQESSSDAGASGSLPISESDFILLCNAVGHEYGADWISVYDKALVVEVIMNRVNSPLYPNTIFGVLSAPYQFTGAEGYIYLGGYSYQVTSSVQESVQYYFDNISQFQHGYLSFYGDGCRNYFS